MEKLRKPFQGVTNIIRFNWHFYILSLVVLCALFLSTFYLPTAFHFYILLLFVLVFATTFISLFVSFYVYDLSDLYQLKWIPHSSGNLTIVNIHAGFDETSSLLKSKFPNAELIVLDFYDPSKHTEVSIKRARKAFPPFPDTKSISSANTTLASISADKIFVIFAAHEIRNDSERIIFFNELHRILKSNGQIIITEHLRDTANFLAYNIGFFHFLHKRNWYKTFKTTNFIIQKEQKITPFITTFTLQKNGTTT